MWRQIKSHLTHWTGAPKTTSPFVASAQSPLVRIAAVGDVGRPGRRLRAVASAVDATGPYDALLVLGDNVYPRGDPVRLTETVFRPFAPVLDRSARLLAILGNHDVINDHAAAQVTALGMPDRWWATTVGPVLVVGLDSTRADDAAQIDWLDRTLAAAVEPWRIVAVHDPPYSAGYQGSSAVVQAEFVPIFERHGVQLVLSGHDHDYQRSHPINGVTYVVSGGAARARLTGSRSFTAASFKWNHFVEVNVFSDRLTLRAVNADMMIGDQAVIAVGGTRPVRR